MSFSGKVWDTYRGLKQDPLLAALTVQEGTSDLYNSRVVVGTGEVRGYGETLDGREKLAECQVGLPGERTALC